ncbi:MAG: discoidin domain-containing protein [Bacteroidaceae bacterium]|nr:discoidin domain-containing protein [Bacteroidaceae bacterium]
MKHYYFYILLFCQFLGSCLSLTNDRLLEEALEIAVDNREELEKVLEHYEGDSLKLKAARFLIENMPGHYSYADTNAIVRYSSVVDSLTYIMKDRDKKEICDSINAVAIQMGIPNLKKRFDIEFVPADYLIRNIDDAFDSWQNGPWAKHLAFDDFCEYLLPYKIEELQLLDDWRSRLKTFHTGNLKELEYCDVFCNSAFAACKQVNNKLREFMNPDHTQSVQYPQMRIESSASIPFGTCDNYAVIASAVMLSAGIPVVRDFTPQWAYRSQGHSWNVVLANDGKKIPFSGVCTTPGDAHKLDEKMTKVYRHTYAMNQELVDLNRKEKYVPILFRNIFMKDVTDEYISNKDILIDVGECGSNYVYLSVFDDRDWSPIAYAKLNKGKCCFKEMGLECVYQAFCYNESGERLLIGEPFFLDYSGEVRYFQANEEERTTLTLKRKYPVLEYVYWYLTRLEGGEFQASNDKDFKTFALIHKIEDCHAVGYDIDVPDTLPAYRYWRYFSNKKGNLCTMAEMSFFSGNNNTPVTGDIIGTDGSLWDLPDRTKEKVFDGDILTFYESSDPDFSWVGMDFGSPVKLSRISYFGRGDGNCIEPGDDYELFYWKDRHWHSLGKQTANKTTIVYDNVPVDGLYILKNLTKGKDERIFTYDNDKQVWW